MWFRKDEATTQTPARVISVKGHRLATELFRSKPIRLFSIVPFKENGLCQHIIYDSRAKKRPSELQHLNESMGNFTERHPANKLR